MEGEKLIQHKGNVPVRYQEDSKLLALSTALRMAFARLERAHGLGSPTKYYPRGCYELAHKWLANGGIRGDDGERSLPRNPHPDAVSRPSS